MIVGKAEEIQKKLQGKAIAYNKVFDRANVFTDDVLKDLAEFCRAHETTFHPDQRVHAALEGRREVWIRIQQFLQLNLDELYKVHKVRELKGDTK